LSVGRVPTSDNDKQIYLRQKQLYDAEFASREQFDNTPTAAISIVEKGSMNCANHSMNLSRAPETRW